MIQAKFIGVTHAAGRTKHRWECTNCRENPKKPECRFNLSTDKDNQTHNCRFCGERLLLRR